jgi:c-di-GMP-binding flagellar brake protein YcgR
MLDQYGDGDRDGELRLNDHVLAEADIEGRPISFRTVTVKVCPTEVWLGLASPDRRLGALRSGQPIRLAVARQATALLGESEYLRPLGESRSRIFAVSLPAALEQVQRRAYVRYEIDLPVQFRRLDPDSKEPRGRSAAGTTVNVSPGGLLLRTDAFVAVGEELDLTLPLSGGDRISTTDRVIRVRPTGRTAPGQPSQSKGSEVAVEFTRITAIDRDWIVRFVLATEHRRRLEAAQQVQAPLFAEAFEAQ